MIYGNALVMTPDDIVDSRQQKALAPRDNLIFELGLFIGALGRQRSFVARDRSDELKLPSDFLGVTYLSYDKSHLTTSLCVECVMLAAAIRKRGARPKWLAEHRASIAANGEFLNRVSGAWWEKINHPEGSSLSFFEITPDQLSGQVVLAGTAYKHDGGLGAEWNSEMTRVYSGDGRISYLWQGRHPLPGESNNRFHGFGTMAFKQVDGFPPKFTRGSGDFWDVNEKWPEKTVVKPIELRRIVEAKQVQCMTSGSNSEKRDLVQAVLAGW